MKKQVKALVLFLSFLLVLLSANAQFSFSIHYTVEDGLPGSAVLDIAQDSSGFIWCATTYGICHFDGYDFKNYIVTAIPDQSFILIFRGKSNRLWFLSYMGYLCYLDNGVIKPYPLNDTIQNIACKGFYKTLIVDTTDRIWFKSGIDNQIICIDDQKIFRIDTIIDDYIFQPTLLKDYYVRQNISMNNNCFWTDNKIDDKQAQALYFLDGNVYSLKDDNSLIYRDRYDPSKYSNVIRFDISMEANGNIWIRKDLIGSLLYLNDNLDEPEIFLEEQRLTRIFKDREGNYWFATEGDGIYLVPSFQFNVSSLCTRILQNDNIIAFDIWNDNILFSTTDEKIYKGTIRDNQIFNIHEFIINDQNLYGRDILWQPDGMVWIVQSTHLRYTEDGLPVPPDKTDLEKPYEIIKRRDGSIAIAAYKGFYIYRDGKLIYDSRNDLFDRHILSIHEDPEGILWLGCAGGLFSYDGDTYQNWGEKYNLLSHWITEIQASSGIVWAGTREKGLGLLFPDSLIIINQQTGLASNTIRSLYLQNDSVIWAGTNRGISKISFNHLKSYPFQIKTYTIWNGLPSNEINQIKEHEGILWVATNNGFASIIEDKSAKSKVNPSLFINNIRINGLDTLVGRHYKLSYKQNNIFISYTGISFKDPGNILYKTRLEGLNDQWTETKNRSVEYFDLSPGTYSFHLVAYNIEGATARFDQAMTFVIRERFTKTAWFRVSLILILSLFVIAVFWWILRNQRNKARIHRAMLEAEQKALRTQMNPHFIFNSLNSIQYFILDKDEESADLYLADFSSLMRKILENSKQNFITLQNELETIQLYLSLENLRFEEKFNYSIDLGDEIDPEAIRIPPMLLQPYLENAIWHGLMQKEGKGKIDVQFRIKDKKYLSIRLEDDGVGRAKAAQLSSRRKGHRSTGMKNIEERITLINKIYKTDLSIRITDLFNEDQTPAGTRVELLIPYISFL